jgi:hypothetical protein
MVQLLTGEKVSPLCDQSGLTPGARTRRPMRFVHSGHPVAAPGAVGFPVLWSLLWSTTNGPVAPSREPPLLMTLGAPSTG